MSTKNTIQPPNNEQIALYAQLREMLQLPMDAPLAEMEKILTINEPSAKADQMRRVINEWFQRQLIDRSLVTPTAP